MSGGSTASTKQFIWSGNERREARDASSAVTAQYFSRGETISGASYYWNKDQLGSVKEMSNSGGTVAWQQTFDPYGVPTTIVSTTAADFGFAGYYLHGRTGLNLTRTRAYSASLGRFITRDPIGERGGSNLYAYVDNEPTIATDPAGTSALAIPAAIVALIGAGVSLALIIMYLNQHPNLREELQQAIQDLVHKTQEEHFKPEYFPGEAIFEPPTEVPPSIGGAYDKNWACHLWCLKEQAEGDHSAGWLYDCFAWCEGKPWCKSK